jgi:hypothetical protein
MTLTDWTTLFANLATVGTTILAWVYARKINESVEKRKNDILKEKEWQVVWADNFLKKAIVFNDTLSSSLVKFSLGHKLDKHKDAPDLIDNSRFDIYKLSELEWDLKNYTLFITDTKKKKQLNDLQLWLLNFLRYLHTGTGKVNFEDFRKNQFEYSKLIREIHSELLEIKPIQKTFDFYEINSN